jgi:hypothetical protein
MMRFWRRPDKHKGFGMGWRERRFMLDTLAFQLLNTSFSDRSSRKSLKIAISPRNIALKDIKDES